MKRALNTAVPPQIITLARVRCPLCTAPSEMLMPRYASISRFSCGNCGTDHEVSTRECCIFCTFGDTICPPQQRRALYFKNRES